MNTQLMARLTVDGTGDATVATGLPALDHLLGVLARYARFDLALEVAPGGPQAQIDAAGQALGDALYPALREDGARGHGFGAASGRARRSPRSRSMSPSGRASSPTSTFPASTSAVSARTSSPVSSTSWLRGAGIVLHVRLAHGEDELHVLESIFKALGAALGAACRP